MQEPVHFSVHIERPHRIFSANFHGEPPWRTSTENIDRGLLQKTSTANLPQRTSQRTSRANLHSGPSHRTSTPTAGRGLCAAQRADGRTKVRQFSCARRFRYLLSQQSCRGRLPFDVRWFGQLIESLEQAKTIRVV